MYHTKTLEFEKVLDILKNYAKTDYAKKQILDTNNTIKNLIADRDKIPDILLRLSNMNGVSEHLINTYNNKYTEFDKRIIENEKKMAPFLSPFPQQIKILKKPLDKQLNIGYNKTIENNNTSKSER